MDDIKPVYMDPRVIEDFLREGIKKALSALNGCIGVFTELAKTGHYPQPLMGRGWMDVIHARDSLQSAAKRAKLYGHDDCEIDPGFTFGDEE